MRRTGKGEEMTELSGEKEAWWRRKEEQKEECGESFEREVRIRKGREEASLRKPGKGETEDEHGDKANDGIIFHVRLTAPFLVTWAIFCRLTFSWGRC
jgi:hypothetical protein